MMNFFDIILRGRGYIVNGPFPCPAVWIARDFCLKNDPISSYYHVTCLTSRASICQVYMYIKHFATKDSVRRKIFLPPTQLLCPAGAMESLCLRPTLHLRIKSLSESKAHAPPSPLLPPRSLPMCLMAKKYLF